MLRLVSEADTVIDGMLKYPNHIRDAERHWDAIQFVAVTPKSFFFSFFFSFFLSRSIFESRISMEKRRKGFDTFQFSRKGEGNFR